MAGASEASVRKQKKYFYYWGFLSAEIYFFLIQRVVDTPLEEEGKLVHYDPSCHN